MVTCLTAQRILEPTDQIDRKGLPQWHSKSYVSNIDVIHTLIHTGPHTQIHTLTCCSKLWSASMNKYILLLFYYNTETVWADHPSYWWGMRKEGKEAMIPTSYLFDVFWLLYVHLKQTAQFPNSNFLSSYQLEVFKKGINEVKSENAFICSAYL